MKTLLKAFVLAAFALISGNARAETVFRSAYEASLLGLPLSRSFVTTHIDGSHYRIEANGRTSKLISIISPFKGNIDVEGELTGLRAQPSSFRLDAQSGSTKYDIAMNYRGTSVANESVNPPHDPKPDLVPLSEDMKHDVIDPISALLIPAKNPQSVCERRLPIYTGRERFDVVLSPGRTETVEIPGFYKGAATVCMARYVPIGGHRSQKYEVKYMAGNKDIEAWFVPVKDEALMALYKLHIGTKLGPLEIELEKAENGPKPERL